MLNPDILQIKENQKNIFNGLTRFKTTSDNKLFYENHIHKLELLLRTRVAIKKITLFAFLLS